MNSHGVGLAPAVENPQKPTVFKKAALMCARALRVRPKFSVQDFLSFNPKFVSHGDLLAEFTEARPGAHELGKVSTFPEELWSLSVETDFGRATLELDMASLPTRLVFTIKTDRLTGEAFEGIIKGTGALVGNAAQYQVRNLEKYGSSMLVFHALNLQNVHTLTRLFKTADYLGAVLKFAFRMPF